VEFSRHAKERMARRHIGPEEVEQAIENAFAETPARTPDRVNVWGETQAGRRPRITTYRNRPDFILSVVAPEEEL
jgi:hypothetical protein